VIATRHQLRNLAVTVDRIAKTLPTAERHLRALLAEMDGYPSQTPLNGAEGIGRTSGPATSTVERTVLAHQLHSDSTALVEIERCYASLVAVVTLLDHIILAALPAVAPPVTCSGGVGREGAHEWGHAPCGAVAHKLGMCSALYMAERRWRSAQGLTEREG
jgi:hypothetical protein